MARYPGPTCRPARREGAGPGLKSTARPPHPQFKAAHKHGSTGGNALTSWRYCESRTYSLGCLVTPASRRETFGARSWSSGA